MFSKWTCNSAGCPQKWTWAWGKLSFIFMQGTLTLILNWGALHPVGLEPTISLLWGICSTAVLQLLSKTSLLSPELEKQEAAFREEHGSAKQQAKLFIVGLFQWLPGCRIWRLQFRCCRTRRRCRGGRGWRRCSGSRPGRCLRSSWRKIRRSLLLAPRISLVNAVILSPNPTLSQLGKNKNKLARKKSFWYHSFVYKDAIVTWTLPSNCFNPF